MNKKKLISLGLLTSITFLSSSCNIVKKQNDDKEVIGKKEESKIGYWKVNEIRDLIRKQRPDNLKTPNRNNIVEYLYYYGDNSNKFYKEEYLIIDNFKEFEEIMYKNSLLTKISKKTHFHERIKHLKNDNELHEFLKKEFEWQFLKNIDVKEVLKENNIFLISNFYIKNKEENKIKTFGLGVNNKNSNLETIKILFFDKEYEGIFFPNVVPTSYPYPPLNFLEVHIIPKSKEIKIELLETEDEILNYHKELLEYNKNNN